jgi:carboxypeptidase family protein
MAALALIVALLFPAILSPPHHAKSAWRGPRSAQTVTGTLQGTVKDSTGGVLPGASVSSRNMETGQSRTTVTNEAGYYVQPFLPIGRYEVSAGLMGFRTVVRQQVAITLNDTRVENFDLAPAALNETVTVTAVAAPINTTSGESRLRIAPPPIAAAFSRSPRPLRALPKTPPPGRTIRRPRLDRRSTSTAPAPGARRFRSTA